MPRQLHLSCIRYSAIVLLLVSLILTQAVADTVPAITPITPNTSPVAVSPGRSDLLLGNDFPALNSVKLSYPDSTILTDTVGDLLFSVRLNPLMLNPTSAQIYTPGYDPSPQVQVYGSGFSESDTSCTLSGLPVSTLSSCSITPNPTYGGVVTASFNVANVPAGSYTITVTGSPTNDFSSASFTVLPPSLVLEGSSGPISSSGEAFGIGFFSTDTSCSLTTTVNGAEQIWSTSTSCSFSSGVPFTVPAAASPGTYVLTVNTNGGDSGEATALFTVTQSTATTSLSPSIATAGSTISTTGSGFATIDTSCTISGSAVLVNPPVSPTCSIAVPGSGAPSGSFTVANVPPGTYTITLTGAPENDFATAGLLVYSTAAPAPPISTTVSLAIYIPPEFTGLTIANVWTSFTNNYNPNSIRLSKQSSADETAPNWWEINVQNILVTNTPSHYLSFGPLVSERVFTVNQTQYVRLFQVTSPTTAGRYFFKAFINGVSIGAENFPTLVVKGSRDPATISGTLRDLGNRNPFRAGKPIYLTPGQGAQIIANGYNALGESVSAQTFINSTADGEYTLFGVAPGTYNITVYAAGYVPITITQFPFPYPFLPSVFTPTPISVAPAQSLEGIDIFLSEGPNVTGTVLSQTAQGAPIQWGTVAGFNGALANRSITVELINIVDGRTVIATNQQPFTLPSAFVCNTVINCATNPNAIDYHFVIQNQLSSWSGEIPQDYANFTSGLPTGVDYFVRAYVNSYVQLAEIRAHVANATIETEVPVPLIRTGFISVTVHFHDSNFTGSDFEDNPITVPSASLTVTAYNLEGIESAQTSATVLQSAREATVDLTGFSSAGQRGIFSQFSQSYGILPGCYYIVARLTSAPLVIGNAATTTNAPIAGTQVVGDLYEQYSNVQACIGLGEGDTQVSLHVFRSPGLNLTIYCVDSELPPLFRTCPLQKFFTATNPTYVYSANVTSIGSQAVSYSSSVVIVGFYPGCYDFFVYMLGFTQQLPLHFCVRLGTNSDASVWMVKNPFIQLAVTFRHERLLTQVNSTDPYAQPINNIDATPVRLEAFDYLGNFVAANETYIPNGAQIANFTLEGMSTYYGDPRYIWSGFYDTTDQVTQQTGGLLLYPWEFAQPYHEFTVRVWVDGYYQQYAVRVIVPTVGNVSLTIFLDRASRVSGTVAGPDFFGFARPQSWAVVDLEPYNYTLSSIIDVEPGNYTTTSLDGFFQVWVPEGVYGMGVLLGGYQSYQAELAVPPGSDIALWVWLENYQLSNQAANGVISAAVPMVVKPYSRLFLEVADGRGI